MSNRVSTGGGGRRDDTLLTDVDAIPTSLREYDHWVVARLSADSARDKRPLAPRRGHTDPENCLGFEEAVTRARKLARTSAVRTEDGERTILALMLDGTPFVGVDLDDVGAPPDLSPDAEQIISKCSTWTEISQSGNSYHLLGVGSKEIDSCRADLREKGHIEIYDGGQYLCLTGNWFDGSPTEVQAVEPSLRWLENEYYSDEPDMDSSVSEENAESSELTRQKPSSLVGIAKQSANNGRYDGRRKRNTKDREYVDLEPSELTVDIIRETGFKIGDRDFRPLWFGSNVGKPSHSEADYYFTCKLSYWCQGDRQLMDECFRASHRYGIRNDNTTPKWDCVHYANGDTYGRRMIKDALYDNPGRHSGKYIDPSQGSE